LVTFPFDPTAVQAEVSRFDKFKLFNVVDSLAGGDVLKWDAVLKLDNSTVLFKMTMKAEQAHFEKRYDEINKSKWQHS
jgi:hypothetical protein